jgi:signal transduction histidine kinase
MVRLFFKVYGVLIATLVCSFMVQSWLMEYVWSQIASQYDYRVRFRPTFVLIERSLAGLPADALPDKFREISEGFGVASRLAPAHAMPERERMPVEQRASFDAGAMVAVDNVQGFTVLKRLAGGEHAVAMEIPGPDNRRAKLISYALNWMVEFTMVAVLVWFWVRPFWSELLVLRRAAEALGEGRFDVRVATGRRSALRELAEALNAMATKLGTLLQSHRSLTSAVSHELRTPIARLRFSHSLALESPSPADKDRLLARMEHDIADIDALTTELLDYARLERGLPSLEMQMVPAEPWLEDLLAEVRVDAQLPVDLRARAEVATLRCEPRYMARAASNLLRNALRHARSTVEIAVHTEGGCTVIEVDDDGAGIPAAERERLFEPFTRLDTSRDRGTGGFGLGLAIVRQVARWHGGDATIAASPLGGARVRIAW